MFEVLLFCSHHRQQGGEESLTVIRTPWKSTRPRCFSPVGGNEFHHVLPSLKLTACTWTWMVGRLLFPFQGRTVSFRGCSRQGFIIQPTILIKRGGLATVKAPHVFFVMFVRWGDMNNIANPGTDKRNCTWKHAITCQGKNMERDCKRKHQFVVAYAYPRHPIILLMEEIPNNHLGYTKPCK